MHSPNSGGAGRPPGRPTGEFAAIEGLKARFEAAARAIAPGADRPPEGDVWIGDDAAVVGVGPSSGSGQVLLATDMLVEGVHVDLRRGTAEDAGFKALMATVSDLAAMGARPGYGLMSVAGPPGIDLDGLGAGLATAATETGCLVVGGDLSQSPSLVVSIAVLGWLAADPSSGPLLRSGARPGDRLFVTGPLGRSAAGLRLVAGGAHAGPVADELVRAHRRPRARLDEGETARLAGATAAIDVSDGLASDVWHLARASGVGVSLSGVPVAEGATAEEALRGGEDYELVIVTGDPDRLVEAFDRAGLRAPVPIGTCAAGPGEVTLEGRPLAPGGWEHRF